jgi:hypothetical protein
LKSLRTTKNSLPFQYYETDDGVYYHIWIEDGQHIYETRIEIEDPASSDQTDFENNFQSDANKRTQRDIAIFDPASGKTAEVVTNSGVDRLAVEINEDAEVTVIGDESPTKYQLKSDYDATGVTVTSAADVTLFTFSGIGVLDFISAVAGSDGYEIVIIIDGTERLRINMNDLGSNLGLANATNVPLWAETANKNFRWHPPTQVGFTTGFTIKAKATGADVTLKHLILYREKTS